MKKIIVSVFLIFAVQAQAFTLNFSNTDFVVAAEFSAVRVFDFVIEVDGELESGIYENPTIINIEYSVSGSLAAGTPSGFTAFQLSRNITGEEFYAQGSSLLFEIASGAELSDGLQVDELVGDGQVFIFNGREVDNGRFHPALFELNSDGTGLIQNSDNIPTQDPLLEVDFGAEYITNLSFDPGNLTLVQGESSGGGGSTTVALLLSLFGLLLIRYTYLLFYISTGRSIP